MRKIARFFYLPLLLCIFITSCHKEDFKVQENSINEFQNKAISWLDKVKKDYNDPVLISLMENADYSKLWLEKNNENDKLLLIPLKSTFNLEINKEANPTNFLIFTLDKTGKILRGNIVQYIPEEHNTSLPKNTFYEIYNTAKVSVNSKFVFLNVLGKLLYQLEYKEGKLYSEGIKKAKKVNNDLSGRTAICIEWYLRTTYYFTDGSSYTTEQYLGSSGSCGGVGENQIPEENETGGGPQTQYEYAYSKEIKWTILLNPSGWWQAISIDNFTGKKGLATPEMPWGKKFTNTSHTYDGIEILSNNYNFVWVKYYAYPLIVSDILAQAKAAGKVLNPPNVGGGEYQVPEKIWSVAITDVVGN